MATQSLGNAPKDRTDNFSNEILDKAVELRQSKSMSLGDAIIAGTALIHDLNVYTHNTDDFKGIAGLNVIDPIHP